MPSDPHTNIFHAYRGPSTSESSESRQLEDNLTRALVITLLHLRDCPARESVLEALYVQASQRSEPYQCRLQVNAPSTDWPAPSSRHLLVIHGGPRLSVGAIPGSAVKGRADAIIRFPRTMIAIESKVGDKVERAQLDRHRATFDIQGQPDHDVTWLKIAAVSRELLRQRRLDPVARFVVSQFEEYLAMNGLGGLTQEHFAFFTLPATDRDQLVKGGIRRVLTALGEQVIQRCAMDWHTHMMNINEGDPDAGVVVEPGERGQTPHVTIVINPVGIDVFANIELGRAYQQFRRAWRADPGGLIEIIRRLGANTIRAPGEFPWRFRVVRRVPMGRPRLFHYWPAVDITAITLAGWSDIDIRKFVDDVISKPEGEAAPEILLVRSYPVQFVLGSDAFIDHLVTDVNEIEAFFNWVGEPYQHV